MKHRCAYAPDRSKDVILEVKSPVITTDPFTSAEIRKEKAREVCPYCKVVMTEL